MSDFSIIRLHADSAYRASQPCAVAIGNFDGVHQGHRAVLAAMTAHARAQGEIPSVLTFMPHPRYHFAPNTPPFLLQHYRDRWQSLRDVGVQRVYIGKFNAQLASMGAQAFCEDMLFGMCGARSVFTGENFVFGAARSGNIATLQALGEKAGVAVHALEGVMVGGHVCSSTGIRHALEQADVARAAVMLGRLYSISGRVIHGDGRGATIGFATANILPHIHQMLPALGVYAVQVRLSDGTLHAGVANIGVRPTFGGDVRPRLEVHLLDASPDLYGTRIQVALIAPIRPEMRFDGVDALRAQIAQDVNTARHILSPTDGAAA